jgi:hypothetical protein
VNKKRVAAVDEEVELVLSFGRCHAVSKKYSRNGPAGDKPPPYSEP